MSDHVGLLHVLAEGLVMLRWDGRTSSDPDALWTRVTLRKPTRCAVTGLELESGDTAYRPIGNQDYRGRRLHPSLIEFLIDAADDVGTEEVVDG